MSCRKWSGPALAVTFQLQPPRGAAPARSLCSSWLTLTSAGSWCRLDNHHKYSAAGRCPTLPPCGPLLSLGIDNPTVNRLVSNNQLIMNCKWGWGIDLPLTFEMCGGTGAAGWGCQCRWFIKRLPLCTVAFDCELVTCSCYLLLLCGLTPSPLPRTKAGQEEPIIGQAVW